MAGAGEFPSDNDKTTPSAAQTSSAQSVDSAKVRNFTPDAVRTIYSALRVNVGYASPEAAQWFGGRLPAGFAAVHDKPVVQRVQVGGVLAAVVLFPAVQGDVPDAVLRALLAAARSSGDADVVIGVSPWGFQKEAKALQRLAEGYDVLLGGGSGAPFPVELTTFAPGIAWSRPDKDGRCVIDIRFMTLPGKHAERPRSWLREVDFFVKEHPLGMEIDSAPDVAGLLD